MLLASGPFDGLNDVANGIPAAYRTPQFTSVIGIVSFVINVILALAISISFIALAWSFIHLMLAPATAEPRDLNKSHTIILWSIVAMLLTLLVFAIKNAIFNTLGMPQ